MVTSASSLREFDQYAPAYGDLLDDPIRNRFAQNPLHFHRRKWLLLPELCTSFGFRRELSGEIVVSGAPAWFPRSNGDIHQFPVGNGFEELLGTPIKMRLPAKDAEDKVCA